MEAAIMLCLGRARGAASVEREGYFGPFVPPLLPGFYALKYFHLTWAWEGREGKGALPHSHQEGGREDLAGAVEARAVDKQCCPATPFCAVCCTGMPSGEVGKGSGLMGEPSSSHPL